MLFLVGAGLRRLALLCVMAAGLTLACGSTAPSTFGDSPAFGSNDDQCASAALRNELDDETVLSEAIDCFFAEYEAGRAVTIDIDIPTVEGDSIYNRYRFDGTTVLIVQDSRADAFGNGSVRARVCDSVLRTNGFLEGIDCEAVNHPGFPEAD